MRPMNTRRIRHFKMHRKQLVPWLGLIAIQIVGSLHGGVEVLHQGWVSRSNIMTQVGLEALFCVEKAGMVGILRDSQIEPQAMAHDIASLRLRGGSGTGIREQLEVPADKIGVVIGKNGATIRDFERQSQCQIWVDSKTNMPGFPTRLINLSGSPNAIESAKRMIRDRLAAEQGRHISEGVVKETLHIPDMNVGLVIGKGGTVIKSIMQASGAKVFIPCDSNAETGERSITISGVPSQVSHAKALIASKVPSLRFGESFSPLVKPCSKGDRRGHVLRDLKSVVRQRFGVVEDMSETPIMSGPSMGLDSYANDLPLQAQYNSIDGQAEVDVEDPFTALKRPLSPKEKKVIEEEDFTNDWREFFRKVEEQQAENHRV